MAQQPEFNEEALETSAPEITDGDLVDFDEFIDGGQFIKNPAVGESVTFAIDSIVKRPAKKIVNPKTKKPMDIKLSSVDYYYDILTARGQAYTVVSWQIVGKLRAVGRKLKSENKSLKGLTIEIKHIVDGQDPNVKAGTDLYSIKVEVDGVLKELDKETNNWK